jgi:hypothetical protein
LVSHPGRISQIYSCINDGSAFSSIAKKGG